MCVCCACVCVVCGAAWHAGKKRVRPKRLRVYCQNARTCSTRGRFAGAHGDVLNVHTEGFFLLSPLRSLFSHSLSLSFSPFLLPVSLALALALPLKSTKQPLSGHFLPYSKIGHQEKNRQAIILAGMVPQEVQNYTEKQIGDVPVHQLQEEMVEATRVIPQESVSERILCQITDVPVSDIPQQIVSERKLEQTSDVAVPFLQLQEEIVVSVRIFEQIDDVPVSLLWKSPWSGSGLARSTVPEITPGEHRWLTKRKLPLERV